MFLNTCKKCAFTYVETRMFHFMSRIKKRVKMGEQFNPKLPFTKFKVLIKISIIENLNV